MAILKAPWTPEQVRNLELRQASPTRHPYTCGTKDNHIVTHPGPQLQESVTLIPTEDGWVCPSCRYTQDWCHAGDANPEVWVSEFEQSMGRALTDEERTSIDGLLD